MRAARFRATSPDGLGVELVLVDTQADVDLARVLAAKSGVTEMPWNYPTGFDAKGCLTEAANARWKMPLLAIIDNSAVGVVTIETVGDWQNRACRIQLLLSQDQEVAR